MPLIKDERYKQFLETGMITLIDKATFGELLGQVKHKNQAEAEALFVLLFYSGRRPIEIVNMIRKDFEQERNKLKVMFRTAKGGLPTTLFFPLKNEHIKRVWLYVQNKYPGDYVFYAFRHKSVNKVKWHSKDGTLRSKTYEKIGSTIHYWVKKWCGFTPYFFRHNRWSDVANKGGTDFEIMYGKGARSLASVLPYRHMSKAKAEKMMRFFK